MSDRECDHSLTRVDCRNALTEDAESIVQLHILAFPGFFLTSLGPQFLRILYAGFIKSDYGICIVAREGYELVGFVTGTAEPARFFKSLLMKEGGPLAVAAVPTLLGNPVTVVRKCFGALFHRGEKPRELPGAALLTGIAVAPEAGGRGVGQVLMRAFCHEASGRGSDCVYLLSDVTNQRANSFYSKCGFRLWDTVKRPGNRIMNRWSRSLHDPNICEILKQ